MRRALSFLAVLLAGCALVTPPFEAEPRDPDDPRPVPIEVRFRGETGLGELELRRVIEDLMLDLSREPDDDAFVFDAALELEDLLVERGWPAPAVQWEISRPPQRGPPLVVTFTIHSGPRVTVEALQLDGNERFADEDLLPLWSRRTAGWFGIGDPLYVHADLVAFADAIRQRYRRAGYLDAEVEGPQVERAAPELARVRFRIVEGAPYRFGEVTVAAALVEALGDAMPADPSGAIAERARIVDFEDRIRSGLRARGHAFPIVAVARRGVDAARRVVDYDLSGAPGPIATVTDVVVLGNELTATGVIRSRIPVEPGDRFDGPALDEALRDLYRLGVFRRVGITPVPIAPDDPREVRLEVVVEEVDPKAIELRAGYGSYERLRGGVRYEDRNLFGLARVFAVEGRASQKSALGQTTLTNPDFLFREVTLTVGGEWFQREEPSYRDEAVGGAVTLSRAFDELTARFGYEYRVRTDPFTDVTAPEGVLVDYDEGRLFLELRNEQRDNLLAPKQGHQEYLRVETLSPALGATVDLWRLRAGWSWLWPVGDELTLAWRGEHGWLWPQEGSANVPLQERYFLGGETTVRSFREDQVGPKDPNGRALGGEFHNLFSSELRWSFLGNFEAALFADAGNVGSEIQQYGFDDMSFGLGGGLRWLLPIGPVRFDAAWNPDPKPAERDWTLHFSVGYPF